VGPRAAESAFRGQSATPFSLRTFPPVSSSPCLCSDPQQQKSRARVKENSLSVLCVKSRQFQCYQLPHTAKAVQVCWRQGLSNRQATGQTAMVLRKAGYSAGQLAVHSEVAALTSPTGFQQRLTTVGPVRLHHKSAKEEKSPPTSSACGYQQPILN
jgi:hypothetical protein